MVNEEKFLESYKQYNITDKFYKNQKELFRYIDDFEIDLLASSFVGLSEWYLQSFLSKSKNYIFYFGLYITYQKYYDNTYTPENTAMFMEFLNKNEKISFFIDKLELNDEEFARYAIQQNILKIVFIFPYISFLSQEQVCALPDREKILENLEQSNAVLQKELKNGNMIYEEMKQKSEGLESNIQGIFDMYNKTKDKLNECK
ncbi:hypothetical protein BKN38_01245 [Helicobacter sp. CLO-3]|uniref:hypothetical protein n=1 Tax=unclassified Helicobacter TaxID=2593540 RepID=UPI000804A423|nr:MULTISPECIES: hypothetical protein [unclassified Helicobacter]OBV29739.1 hypothetical protein BA723_00050 [Helicobacter sp. CLO-3]OHU85192.1 hypothetical protein BKN38_01245 [Helicobacter sp. CLO-3]